MHTVAEQHTEVMADWQRILRRSMVRVREYNKSVTQRAVSIFVAVYCNTKNKQAKSKHESNSRK